MWDKKIFSLFFRAMANPGAKEQFLKQFENIVEGIKQNKAKVSITKHMLKSFSSFKLLLEVYISVQCISIGLLSSLKYFLKSLTNFRGMF